MCKSSAASETLLRYIFKINQKNNGFMLQHGIIDTNPNIEVSCILAAAVFQTYFVAKVFSRVPFRQRILARY